MTTAKDARLEMRTRMEGGGLSVPLRWQNEAKDSNGSVELPDTRSPFVYSEFINEGPEFGRGPSAFGGGAGRNLYRNNARWESYVFVPKSEGMDRAETIAEQIAALFRSYRSSGVSCYDATVYPGGDGADLKPPGLTSEVGNYFWARCEVQLTFEQIG